MIEKDNRNSRRGKLKLGFSWTIKGKNIAIFTLMEMSKNPLIEIE
jgi:hypothetical protein